jgi:ABC-2 type transport system permease protein
VLVILSIAALLPRTYERVQDSVRSETRMLERELERPVRLDPTATTQDGRVFEQQMRQDLEERREPGYYMKAAAWELEEVQRLGNYAVLVPLAGLLGVALISSEVARGSIYQLLSRPAGRSRILLAKYAVCAAGLLAVSVLGGVAICLSGLAHGYPTGAIELGRIFGAAALMWLGSLFVLGMSLLASVIFGDVIRTLLAVAAAIYLVHVGPDLVRGIVEVLFWSNSVHERPFREVLAWQDAFERFRLSNYWGGFYPFAPIRTTMSQSLLVCLVTALPPLLLALWVFKRKAY